eukprot:CAMPEP_0171473060 /NCGR_PEP_ID=MMETSP0946-20130122/1625_1 /TAXON_ID=109269 /ORGANISM="Vaucheria litorea, Strain CCMP2940" /LENGTH=203 /DNA_ID=CAMNT_0012002769 /DNA_START=609 /DNA_END=1220 /DNA_ORIENTATION=+
MVQEPLLLQIAVGFLLYMQRPYIIGMFIIAVPAMMQSLFFMSCFLQFCGSRKLLEKLDKVYAKFLMAPAFGLTNWNQIPFNTKWMKAEEQSNELVAHFQVMFGILLIFELFLPRRNIIMVFLYWQLMRMGVTMENVQKMRSGKDGNLNKKFALVHQQILGILGKSFVPNFLPNYYQKLANYMKNSTKIPTQTEAQNSKKCSIM